MAHYSRAPRYHTNHILELMDEGVLDVQTVVMAALNYLSDSEVKEMAELNQFFDDEEELDDD